MTTTSPFEPVNILLVDDQPAKLMAYEVILKELGENLIVASSGREALEQLLKNEISVILVDVCMPELDGFELAAMIREHPRFRKTAMIFVSAIQVTDLDRLRGYEMGAVDYLPVPVVPEVLRAKVKVFAELYRKTRELERLNVELEDRVRQRTAELEASNGRLRESEQRRSLAIAAGKMGSWDWDCVHGDWMWDGGQYRIFGVKEGEFVPDANRIRAMIYPDDLGQLQRMIDEASHGIKTFESEFRVCRPDGEVRWCVGIAAATTDSENRVVRVSGVTFDITERRRAEQRQSLLAKEVDHRAKNALAVVQSIVRLTHASNTKDFLSAIEGRISALARVHTVLSLSSWEGAEISALVLSELEPYGEKSQILMDGPRLDLPPATAQILALVLHELATNAAKYGALSAVPGRLRIGWKLNSASLEIDWQERGGPPARIPDSKGFGTRSVIASIQSQLSGTVDFNWQHEGLYCRISVPAEKIRLDRWPTESDRMTLVAPGQNYRSARVAS